MNFLRAELSRDLPESLDQIKKLIAIIKVHPGSIEITLGGKSYKISEQGLQEIQDLLG